MMNECRTSCVRFAPSGRGWAAASVEGLLIYALDAELAFDPMELGIEITPQSICKTFEDGNYSKALLVRLIAV